MSRAAIGSILFLGVLAGALFGPAGRLEWPMGWAVWGVFAGMAALALALFDRELLRERSALPPGGERWDPLVASLGFLALYPGTLAVAALDVGRRGGAPGFPDTVQAVAFAVFVGGYAFAFESVRVNPFFSTFVRVQRERGHVVIDRGPYAVVRHPGYAGTLLAHAALPFALGSLRSLVPAAVGIALFVLRTAREDATLAAELPGYPAYRERVRWRLLPGVW